MWRVLSVCLLLALVAASWQISTLRAENSALQSAQFDRAAAVALSQPVRPGETVLLGDSQAERAPWDVHKFAVPGVRSDQLVIPTDIEKAGKVIVMVGTNDRLQGRKPVPPKLAQSFTLIAPTDPGCRAPCSFVQQPDLTGPDGVHLSAEGYRQLAGYIRP